MATYKMKANRTFEGNEGLIRRGDIFEVENKERANELERLELAAPAEGEVTNIGQLNAKLSDASRKDLEAEADKYNLTYTDETNDADLRNSITRERERAYVQEQATQTTGTQNVAGEAAAPTGNQTKDSSK